MINCEQFYKALNKNGINFFAGVPDSLLKSFCAYLTDHTLPEKNIIAANEGGAVALASGYHLSTGKIGLVYMQNSGQGNSINPLVSLADPEVYSIPMLLMIGWRAEPGIKDEPQHVKQGKITLDLLKVLGIPYEVLPSSNIEAAEALRRATEYMKEKSAPYALVIKKDTFAPYKLKVEKKESIYKLSREEAIKTVIDNLDDNDVVISTTGHISRELFEYREKLRQGHGRDFLTVGSMGHSSTIALGIAKTKPGRQVFCLDGDGALIMQMGSLAIIGSNAPGNFKHIVFNNGAHDSVGGQPTAAFSISIPEVAKACGYKKVFQAGNIGDIKKKMSLLKSSQGPILLEIRVSKGARPDLGRPTSTPKENKQSFMEFLSDDSVEKLERILIENKTKNIFLVTGKESYSLSGAEDKFKKLLSSYKVTRFSDFGVNPNLKDLEKGIKTFKRGNYDLVLAVGGGSAIDMAKLINIFSAQSGNPVRYIKKEKEITKKGKPLVAIPTTSGTGSEVTHFAVIYIDKIKYSVAHKYILPDYSIVDPSFTFNLSPYITASTGMDALCQAIESYWSVNSTDISKEFSRQAIKLAISNLEEAVKNPSLSSRRAMSKAAHLAGKAINIAKTTAPHAISYTLTSYFGISHGHAVGLTLGKILKHNRGADKNNTTDKRGSVYVRKTMDELCALLGVANTVLADKKLEKLMKIIGLKTKLKDFGVKNKDLDLIVKNVNLERFSNNPVIITEKKLKETLTSIL